MAPHSKPAKLSTSLEPSSANPDQNPQDHMNKGYTTSSKGKGSSEKGPQVTSTQKPSKVGSPGHGKKVENPPASAFAEPSEPSAGKPRDNSSEQLTGTQEENPQLVAGREKSKL